MTREEFRQHFISALSELDVQDYEDIEYVVEPCIEKDKPHQNLDEIMRLVVLPQTRTIPFDQVINILNIQEGYFPCWIEISKRDGQIFLKTSLRMRKVQKSDNTGTFPFRVAL